MFLTANLSDAIKRLNEAFGENWENWLPETLKMAIENRWGTVDNINFERILAVRNLLKNKFFWHDVDVFEVTINALNWTDADHRVAPHPSPGQIDLGVKKIRQIEDDGGVKFGPEVLKYIASIFIDRDIIYIPDSFGLKGAQKYLDLYFKDNELKKIAEVKWKSIQDGEGLELEEKPSDVQVGKLLAIERFVKMGGVAAPEDRSDLLTNIILG